VVAEHGAPFPWRMDDLRVTFPVFEKALELGVPLGPQPVEATTTTWD
jgi:uncharacterized protein